MATEPRPFDAVEYLTDDESMAAFLDESFASGDASEIGEALSIVARARNMSDLAKQTVLTRHALYKALSRNGNPRLDTLLAVTKALGYECRSLRQFARLQRRHSNRSETDVVCLVHLPRHRAAFRDA